MTSNIFNLGNIHNVYIAFEDDPSKGKDRPVLIIKEKNADVYAVMKITGTGFDENSSEFRKKTRYPIVDWQKCGLDKPSFVKSFPRDMVNISKNDFKEYRGIFSEVDKKGFVQHIKDLNQFLKENPKYLN